MVRLLGRFLNYKILHYSEEQAEQSRLSRQPCHHGHQADMINTWNSSLIPVNTEQTVLRHLDLTGPGIVNKSKLKVHLCEVWLVWSYQPEQGGPLLSYSTPTTPVTSMETSNRGKDRKENLINQSHF